MRNEGRSSLSETASRPTVIIAGAGIGGLTAALALAAKQFRVIILEGAKRLEEVGAGLQISPNASRILNSLGVSAHLAGQAVSIDAIRVISGRTGDEIVRIPFTDAASRFGAPYWIVHRADLQAALLARVAEVPNIELRLGCAYESCTANNEGVTVVQDDGQDRVSLQALALIGADGVRSAVRAQFFPTMRQPQFSGFVAWRGTCDAQRLSPELRQPDVQLWLAPGAHIVTYPVNGGRRVNIVIISRSTWNKPGWNEDGYSGEIATRLSPLSLSEGTRTLTGAISAWTKWAMFTMPDCGWAHGRIALLGDASHAMLPFAAQGAGMAIEDAAVLAQCLADGGAHVEEALHRYGELRHARVERVRHTARQNGRIYHFGAPVDWARDLSMKLLGGRTPLSRQQWIYDWKPAALETA